MDSIDLQTFVIARRNDETLTSRDYLVFTSVGQHHVLHSQDVLKWPIGRPSHPLKQGPSLRT